MKITTLVNKFIPKIRSHDVSDDATAIIKWKEPVCKKKLVKKVVIVGDQVQRSEIVPIFKCTI